MYTNSFTSLKKTSKMVPVNLDKEIPTGNIMPRWTKIEFNLMGNAEGTNMNNSIEMGEG